MISGMLWFDRSASPLKDKIQKMAYYYANKYMEAPNVIYVNPGEIKSTDVTVNGITIKPLRFTLPGHFLVCKE